MTERSCHRIHPATGVECARPDTRDAHSQGHSAEFTNHAGRNFVLWGPDMFDRLRWDRAARSAPIPDAEFDPMLESVEKWWGGLLERLDREGASS